MTPVQAVQQWLANGARQDDPVLAQCGANDVARTGEGTTLVWGAFGVGEWLSVTAWPKGLTRFAWLHSHGWGEDGAVAVFVDELPAAFWSHLARMTEGA